MLAPKRIQAEGRLEWYERSGYTWISRMEKGKGKGHREKKKKLRHSSRQEE